VRLPLLLTLETLLQIFVDHFLLHQLGLHRHYVAIAARIGLLVSLGEVVEVVRAQVELDQMVELGQQFFPLQLIHYLTMLELFLGEEQPEGCNVVVDA
jgi:hypothetical protein